MKKLTLITAAIMASFSMLAEPFIVDGINYSIIEGTNSVTVDGLETGVPAPAEVHIPSTVEHDGVAYTVTELSICAFYGRMKIKDLTIPETVTKIGDRCFSGTGITSFKLPSAITVLPNNTFSNCDKLETITMPENLTTIEFSAFQNCTSLTSITLPKTVTFIGNAAFLDCNSLTEVDYKGTILEWMGIEFADINANPVSHAHLLKANGKEITAINVMYPKVQTLRPFAFAGCTNLVSVDVMDGIPSIGTSAFEGCTSLESITLPSSLESIGEWAFKGCTSMKKVNASSVGDFLKITMAGWESNPLTSGADLHVMQNGYMAIITEIVVPEGLTAIGNFALNGAKSIERIVLPETITGIGESAFNGCAALTEINIPTTVETIGYQAFAECTSLKDIVLPYATTEIGQRTFINCTSLDNVKLPSAMTAIPDYMFSGCSSLTSLTLPESVSEIGIGAFSACSSLSAVNFPSELFRISNMAFMGTAITEAVINSPKLRLIGQQAFYGCESLENALLPAALSNIGSEAFAFTALKTMESEAPTAPFTQADMCLDNTYAECILTVPQGSLESYKRANGWSQFANIIEKGSSSIETISTPEQTEIYFNLNGVEVRQAELSPGIYIVKKGTEVSKINIR